MMPVNRVLVTGACGFVGNSIVQALLNRGVTVIAVDRVINPHMPAISNSQYPGQIQFIEADAGDVPTLDVDALIHAAAVTATPFEANQSPEENFRSNIDPCLQMLKWADANNVARAVFLSSSAVHRETAPGPVLETDIPSPLGLYAIAKHTCEHIVETLKRDHGRDVVAVRLSSVYGTYELPRPTRPRTSLVSKLVYSAITDGKMTIYRDEPAMDWTFAADIGHAIYHLLQQEALQHHLYNVASEMVYSPLEIAEQIHNRLPDTQLHILDGVDPNAKPLTRKGYLSNSRLTNETSFKDWTSLERGLKQVIDWQFSQECV
jgi:nucleoside-diphosphate-sugar epimerase